jgi:hypothetical protein
MERLSRRSFTRRVIAASLLPALTVRSPAQTNPPAPGGPEKVAGYTPDAEDRAAMNRFLADQEKGLVPLRATPLPNDLAPATVFRSLSPTTRSRRP